MKAGARLDLVAAALQADTACHLDIVQLLEVAEMAVDQWRVGERPQVFRRLHFRRVGRQKGQVNVVRNLQAPAGMPPRTVEDQYEFTVGSSPGLCGEGGQFDGERLGVDRGGGLPERAPGLGMDEADEVAPLVAGLHRNDRALSGQRPDLAQDRL